MTEETVRGFLLSRQWRDFSDGIEISFWAQSEKGPLRLTVSGQSAVCFIDRTRALDLPANVQRKEVDLKSTAGELVDALYFKAQRELTTLHRSAEAGAVLHEADLKPADRYLMERFVNAGFIAQGTIIQRDGYSEIRNPKLKPCAYDPALTLVSVDIETRGLSQQLYSIALHSDDTHVVLMVGDDTAKNLSDFELCFYPAEKELLEGFFLHLHAIDPDVIVGWNVIGFDLDFIARKCEQLNIALDLGRGGDASAVLQVGSGANPIKIARVPGRAVLDGIEMLRSAFWSFESFSLENVGQELLGRGKTIKSVNKVEEINHLYQTNKPELARYNIEDCRLVTEIFAKADLINFAIQRARMTGLPIDKIGGAVQTFDNLYLPRLHRKGYVAATSASGDSGSPGGYVLDSKPGLYRNVIVLDFKSLYPSIIRTFLIDPLGLSVGLSGNQVRDNKVVQNEVGGDEISGPANSSAGSTDDLVPGFEGAMFSRDEHILPELIEELWSKRDEAKAQKNAALSQAIKIIMNSLYGVLGSSSCRFHHHQLASSITRRGHEIIQLSQKFIEQSDLQVIYGDTDSLFVLLDENISPQQANAVGENLQLSLNEYWQQRLRDHFRLRSHLEVEFETLYTRFIMPTVRGAQMGTLENAGSKKRYAGQIVNSEGLTELVFKGLEAVRTDWTLMAREFQRELYAKVFNDEPIEDLIRETTDRLLKGELDEKLVYRKRLRRKLSDYQRNVPPHVQAARKSANPLKWIDYVITVQGPEPSEERVATLDYQHYVDKQLVPVADGILHFLNTSYHSVISEQSELF